MACIRSATAFLSRTFFLRFTLAATTISTSTSEEVFWTQGLPEPEPISELTATVTLASKTTNPLRTTTTPTFIPNPSTCNATSISCPACNDATIIDSFNKTYRITCNSELYSDSPYPVQRWLTPSACIAECAKYPWCKGATSWRSGNCQLARGENVFPQAGDEGDIALLQIPEGYVPEPPATVPRPFPTGPVVPIPVPTERPRRCDLRDVECPCSRGETVVDASGARYAVRCNFQPMCREFASVRGRQSKCSCLARCDGDPTCLAALFNRGKCDLCRGSLEGLSTYASPRNYIVFVSERREDELSITSVSVTSTGTSTRGPILSPTRQPSVVSSYTGSRRSSSSSSRRGSPTTSTRRISESKRASAPSASRSSTRTTPTRRSTTTSQSSIPRLGTTNTSSQLTTRPIRSSPTTSTLQTSTFSPINALSSIPAPSTPTSAAGILNLALLPPISAAICPASDNSAVHASGNDRSYIVQCDIAFEAAVTNLATLSPRGDFAACAAECGGECGGMVFNAPQENVEGEVGCTLYTGISVIRSQAGATAGVWVRFPGAVAGSTAMATAVDTSTTALTDVAASATSSAMSWAVAVPTAELGSKT